MKHSKILALLMSMTITIPQNTFMATPQWSFVSYIEGANSLQLDGRKNIKQMIDVGSTSEVNILAQYDDFESQQSTFYNKISINGFIGISNLFTSYWQNNSGQADINQLPNTPMGKNPGQGLSDLMNKIVIPLFPAKKYAYNLWNHGNGVINQLQRANLAPKTSSVSGASGVNLTRRLLGNNNDSSPNFFEEELRGILYNETAQTFLPVSRLSTILEGIKPSNKNNPIDLLCMDACCMAMIEVAYEVKDGAKYMVASQQTEPSTGWPYDTILKTLIGNPTISPHDLAVAMVTQYGAFYAQSGTNNDPLSTLSAIDLSKIKAASDALDTLCQKILTAQFFNLAAFKTAIQNAHAASQSFAVIDYIDLYSFYVNLDNEIITALNTAAQNSSAGSNTDLIKSALDILPAIENAKIALSAAVIANSSGSGYTPPVQGLSIYFPTKNTILDGKGNKVDPTAQNITNMLTDTFPGTTSNLNGYSKTKFSAQYPNWMKLVISSLT